MASHVLVRVFDELLWSLRRAGFPISTAQAIDVLRAAAAVGIDRAADLRDALAAVIVQRSTDRPRFESSFDAFFASVDVRGEARAPGAPARGTLRERLAARGFDDADIAALYTILQELSALSTPGFSPLTMLLDRGADLDRALALAGMSRPIDAHSGAQLGFLSHRLLGQLGSARAQHALLALRPLHVDALGRRYPPGFSRERGDALADALAEELERAVADVRAHLRETYEARVAEAATARRRETTPFASLIDSQIDEVRRAVRRFAERLRGAARVRARHARRGRIDPHRTLRHALHTGGVPFRLAYRRPRPHRPKLVLLCDVSDSVRHAASFLLEFVYAAQELFAGTRSFVFVSELGETTKLFAREPVRTAIARAWGGGIVPSTDNSNYGRVLRSFEARHLPAIDRRTTVVILGDGRSNYVDPAPEVLGRIRTRSRALLWLCPEPRGQWSEGDSAMVRYAPECTAVYEVSCAADLERAARAVVGRL